MKRTFKASSLVLILVLLLTGSTVGAAVPAAAEATESGEKTVYVNGEKTESGDGTVTSPYNSFAEAVDAVRTTGGTVVVTGKTVINTRNWRTASGSLTITSVDPVSGTDYRGANCTGAYLANRGASEPYNSTASALLYLDDYGTNRIVLSRLHYATNGAGIINFMMHDLDLDDVTNYRSTDWNSFTANHFNFGFNKNSADNLQKTVVTLNTTSGNFAMGLPTSNSGSTNTAGLDLTVNRVPNTDGSLYLGNRGGGTLTVKGDVFLTLNMPDTKVILTGTNLAIADGGCISLICNNGATRDLRIGSISVPKYILTCEKGATASHGSGADRFLIQRDADQQYTQAIVRKLDGTLVDVLTFDAEGKAEFVAPAASEYVVSYLTVQALGAQKTEVGTDGTYAIRFVAGIGALDDMEGAGLKIVSANGYTAETQNIFRLTKKLLAKDGENNVTEITAEQFGMEALCALIVEGVAADTTDVFTVTPFVIIGNEIYYGTAGNLSVGSGN